MTTAADVKAVLDAATGLGLAAVFREGEVLDETAFPYVSILDPVSDAPALSGDARTLAYRRLLQVDLWQDAEEVDDTLVDRVVAELDGARPEGSYPVRLVDVVLVPEPDRVVHHAITLSINRPR